MTKSVQTHVAEDLPTPPKKTLGSMFLSCKSSTKITTNVDAIDFFDSSKKSKQNNENLALLMAAWAEFQNVFVL